VKTLSKTQSTNLGQMSVWITTVKTTDNGNDKWFATARMDCEVIGDEASSLSVSRTGKTEAEALQLLQLSLAVASRLTAFAEQENIALVK
jgi:hypothetical protein